LFDRERFFIPAMQIARGAERSRGQGWPKATATGGA